MQEWHREWRARMDVEGHDLLPTGEWDPRQQHPCSIPYVFATRQRSRPERLDLQRGSAAQSGHPRRMPSPVHRVPVPGSKVGVCCDRVRMNLLEQDQIWNHLIQHR